MDLVGEMGILGCGICLAGAAWANITVGSGTTLDWTASPPDESEQIDCAGGTIVYSGADDLVIKNVFSLSAATAFNITGTGKVRFARKFLKATDAECLVLNASAEFGSDSSGTFSFLPENAVSFTPEATAAGAALTLLGYPSCTVLPEKWSNPIPVVWANNVYMTLYGENMFNVVDGVVTLPPASEDAWKNTWRFTDPQNVGGDDVTVTVPSNVTCVVRRMDFNPKTGSGSSWSKEQAYSNAIHVEKGGVLQFQPSSTLKYYGAISGEGNLAVSSGSGQVQLFGPFDELSATSQLQLNSNRWGGKDVNYSTRLGSSFPGTVVMGQSSPTNCVSIGFYTPDLQFNTNSVYRLEALQGGSANLSDDRSEVYGARVQYNARQKIIIGKLTGAINVVASGVADTSDLEIEQIDDAAIYVKNGLRIRVLSSVNHPSIYYSSTQASTNTVTLVNGTFLNLIELPGAGQTVYLHTEGDAPCAVGAVTGSGTLVIEGGTVRVGRTEKMAKVEVRNGAQVTFGGGEDLADLLGAKPAIWLDAATTNAMVGAWNKGWSTSTSSGGGGNVLKSCPAITFNGASSATWTNGFPLIEKWFDHRPDQRLNYGWQDRNVNYTATLYTLVYPFLVPNGLNGRPYMSFGIHGLEDLDPNTYGLADSKNNDVENYRRERRRMPIMQDMDGTTPRGENIPVETAILVFGSQNGGGRALLGGYSGQGNNNKDPGLTANGRASWINSGNPISPLNFTRTGYSECYDATNGVFSSNYETFIDNESVDPRKTGLNGAWQIITVNGNGKEFRSLGMSSRFVFAGGQNYAELLVYTNKLSTTERRTVESYLAMKWGLPNGMSVKGPVEVAADSAIRGQALDVTGAGTWRLDAPEAALTLDGTFAGTIEIPITVRNGQTDSGVILNGSAGSARGHIALTCESKLKSGTYPLVGGAAVAAMPWTVTAIGETGRGSFTVTQTDAGISLVVGSGGTLLLFR